MRHMAPLDLHLPAYMLYIVYTPSLIDLLQQRLHLYTYLVIALFSSLSVQCIGAIIGHHHPALQCFSAWPGCNPLISSASLFSGLLSAISSATPVMWSTNLVWPTTRNKLTSPSLSTFGGTCSITLRISAHQNPPEYRERYSGQERVCGAHP
eukprot:GHVS01065812.1.p1 GENE.GHVS01065812.1~~GHVS01065812.1.p1  ORF type:complete len:152 (-),score=1.04 GHVS01065812.1:383-838(-)